MKEFQLSELKEKKEKKKKDKKEKKDKKNKLKLKLHQTDRQEIINNSLVQSPLRLKKKPTF